ncbi:MAG TPA: CheR family methyltransferase, partial [Chthonomonadaceae bacterium]|nr:CheR family methyltransferase [Chthonomonadaceae bacterium]
MNKASNPHEFESLLEYLKLTRGFDFTAYKRTSLMRRIQKRMLMVGVERYDQYIGYLEAHADEFTQLFNTILINLTAFFRDPSCWEYLAADILPLLLSRDSRGPLRVWSAGCATGEEAYTLAMVLAEGLGVHEFHNRVKIYATDASEEALSRARQAAYTSREIQGIPPALLDKYFEFSAGRYIFERDLRRSFIFGRHNLIQDAPISHIDLLVCRNCLMYFNADAQARIISGFHFALEENGFLFLGKAETLLTHSATFQPVDMKQRIFTKMPKDNLRERLAAIRQSDSDIGPNHLVQQSRLREAALDTIPAALMLVDLNGRLMLANERARKISGLTLNDIGRPFQDLEISYRPIELRSCMDQAYTRNRPVILKDVEWQTPAGDLLYLDVQVTPIPEGNNTPANTAISFTDVTESHHLRSELQHFNQELETAYEELQST